MAREDTGMRFAIIEVPAMCGDGDHPAAEGPAALTAAVGLRAAHRVEIPPHGGDHREASEAVGKRAAGAVREVVAGEGTPLVFAGSCDVAAHVVAGIGDPDVGVIWIDAHADFNTPETSVSGFWPGMALAQVARTIPEDRIALIGVRDLSPAAEAKRLERSGIHAGDGALAAVDAERVYVHLDLDALDPSVGRGYVDEPVPGGLSLERLCATIDAIGERFAIAAATVATFVPARDDGATLRAGIAATRRLLAARSSQSPPMSTETTSIETDQAAREASGAHPYGRYLEEFQVGDVYKHWPAKTVTEGDDHLFCLITMNHHPLHINDVYAQASQQGRNVVVGPLVYSLALGMSVSDVSGKAIANLATEELSHPAPVFHGDTLFVESEVLEVKESRSKPDRGTVRVHTRVYNQHGTLVAEFKRVVLVPRRTPGETATGEGNVE
jgi:acyl dehydratase/arginase family enzyme